MELNNKYLKWVVVPGRNCPALYDRFYSKIYNCWKEVWLEALHELEGVKKVYSDDFTRQDEIGGLFHGNDCVGLLFFKMVDLKRPIDREDSYFKVWSENAMNKLISHGSRVLICSYFTIHQNYRKQVTNISTKDLLVVLGMLHFLNTNAHSMTGTMRNNKSMNDAMYRHGAVSLQKEVDLHGVKVDLVGVYKDVKIGNDKVTDFAREAWNNRIEYTDLPADIIRAA